MTQIAIKAQIKAIKEVTAKAIKENESAKQFLHAFTVTQRPSSTATTTKKRK